LPNGCLPTVWPSTVNQRLSSRRASLNIFSRRKRPTRFAVFSGIRRLALTERRFRRDNAAEEQTLWSMFWLLSAEKTDRNNQANGYLRKTYRQFISSRENLQPAPPRPRRRFNRRSYCSTSLSRAGCCCSHSRKADFRFLCRA
jgi:hypothetical protein